MTRLKLNTWTGVLDIVNCVLFALSWFVIFGAAFSDASNGGNSTDSAATFFYAMAWIGVVVNIVALVQSRKHGISLVGSVLGIIGSALFGFTAALAFPAMVVLIVAAVFIMLQHPSKNVVSQNDNSQSPTN
ncbi:MAG TPA: transporter [Levilactobacillus hammesii]|uniref:Transporter n=1 Tax=Levilactobacillus hammesii TaxID=267633 RepID=A0A921F1N5_9LACO|nr:transporter [Levilactobacillus hammesii]